MLIDCIECKTKECFGCPVAIAEEQNQICFCGRALVEVDYQSGNYVCPECDKDHPIFNDGK